MRTHVATETLLLVWSEEPHYTYCLTTGKCNKAGTYQVLSKFIFIFSKQNTTDIIEIFWIKVKFEFKVNTEDQGRRLDWSMFAVTMELWLVKTFCIISLLIVTLLCGLLPIKVSELSSTNKKGKISHEPMKGWYYFPETGEGCNNQSHCLLPARMSWPSCTVSVITNQIVCYRRLCLDSPPLSQWWRLPGNLSAAPVTGSCGGDQSDSTWWRQISGGGDDSSCRHVPYASLGTGTVHSHRNIFSRADLAATKLVIASMQRMTEGNVCTLSTSGGGGKGHPSWWGVPPSFPMGGLLPFFLRGGYSLIPKGGYPIQDRIGYPHHDWVGVPTSPVGTGWGTPHWDWMRVPPAGLYWGTPPPGNSWHFIGYAAGGTLLAVSHRWTCILTGFAHDQQ